MNSVGMNPENLRAISSYASKLLREKFGRGPRQCSASFGCGYLVIYVQGFISPMEEVLLQQGENDTISVSRSIVTETITAELKGVIQVQLGLQVSMFYQDWSYENNTGVLVAVTLTNGALTPGSPFETQERLITEVNRISAIIERPPAQTAAYQLSPNLYVVMRSGILIAIEKALIAKGFDHELRATKAELEKRYFHHDQFSAVLNQQVKDIFIDLDLSADNSLLCFVTE